MIRVVMMFAETRQASRKIIRLSYATGSAAYTHVDGHDL